MYMYMLEKYVKIHRKCHNYEAQPSRGTKRRTDKEHIKTTQTPHTKPQTHKEELQQENRLRIVIMYATGSINHFYLCGTLTLCPDGAQTVTQYITKTRLFKYVENFTKNGKFSIKNSDIFHFSAENIDCGYSLESPRRGGSNEYPQSMFSSKIKKKKVYPCIPQFYYIKVGFKEVNNKKACFHDDQQKTKKS